MQYGGGLTVEGQRDAAFAINEPFVLIEGTVLPNLKSRHRRHIYSGENPFRWDTNDNICILIYERTIVIYAI